MTKTDRTITLNDTLRQTGVGGQTLLTPGVNQLGNHDRQVLLSRVREYDEFDVDDDESTSEHEFGALTYLSIKYFWKIDYYDQSYRFASQDPSNDKVTARVITVMRADEY